MSQQTQSYKSTVLSSMISSGLAPQQDDYLEVSSQSGYVAH